MSLSLTAPLLGHRPSLYSFLIQRYLVFSIHLLQAVGYSVFAEDFNSFISIAATKPHELVITGDFDIHLVWIILLTISPLSFCLFSLLSASLSTSPFLSMTKTTFSTWS